MKVEKTYLEIITFDGLSSNYLQREVKEETDKTSLSKCIESVHKQIRKILPEYYEKRDLIRMQFCLKKDDKTKQLLMEKGDYTYTEEGLKKCKEKLKELDSEKVIIHSRILPDNNTFNLTGMEKEIFAGFVIDAVEDEFEKQFETELQEAE